MSVLLFKSIKIISLSEKRARKINFHPEVTVITGENDTGKSSLIKTIYKTFGATPAKENNQWLNTFPCSVIDFSVDDRDYSILHFRNRYAIFNGTQELLCLATSVSKELGPYISKLLNFKLQLPDRHTGVGQIPPPAFLFLPYYIDQDSSWTDSFSGFARLQQFSNFRKPVAEYHAGLLPNEYYELKTLIELENMQKSEIEKEIVILNRVLENQRNRSPKISFNINFDAFEVEIRTLLARCSDLSAEEQVLKEELSVLYNQKTRIKSQIDLLSSAMHELKHDYKFLIDHNTDDVDCPTCGAHYTDSFPARLDIAKDEGRCVDLLSELTNQDVQISIQIMEATGSKEKIVKLKSEIEEVLSKKKSEITLKDLIDQHGKQEFEVTINSDIDQFLKKIAGHENIIGQTKEKLKKYSDRSRKEEILKSFQEMFSRYLISLDVTTVSSTNLKSTLVRISETGSDLPRALLAYYYAFLNIMHLYSSTSLCPFVIDSPNQQEQDEAHIKKMIEFIFKEKPHKSQLILGAVDLHGIETIGSVIKLNKKRSLLLEEEYDQVWEEVRPLLSKSFKASEL